MRNSNPLDLIYAPSETYAIGQQYFKDRKDGKGWVIPLGLRELDRPDEEGNFFLGLRAPEVLAAIARPGHGKTAFMVWWARARAKWLKARGITNRAVVYISYEQATEELYGFVAAADAYDAERDRNISVTRMELGEISDDEWARLEEAGARFPEQPLWFTGFSLSRRKKRPRMTFTDLWETLEAAEKEWGFDIDMLFLDYLQLMPYERNTEAGPGGKIFATMENYRRMKDLALRFGAPVVVGVQAVREVDDYKPLPIPEDRSGQWTSGIEQYSDKIIGLVRPRKYRQDGEFFGSMQVKGHNQLLIAFLKQKLGPSNFVKWVSLYPEYNHLDHLEIENVPAFLKD